MYKRLYNQTLQRINNHWPFSFFKTFSSANVSKATESETFGEQFSWNLLWPDIQQCFVLL